MLRVDPGRAACTGIGEAALDWSEVYERLARRPGQPDLLAWAELERQVRAWAGVRATGLSGEAADAVAAAVCMDVWQHLSLARGASTFEGFVQGRFVGALRALRERESSGPVAHHPQNPLTPQPPLPQAGEGEQDDEAARIEGLRAALVGLRARNPRHHRAIELVYADEATLPEAADALAVDVWVVRALVTRAQAALAEGLARAERKLLPAGERRPRPSSRAKPGRPGGKPRRQNKGRPPAGGRPR